MILVKPEDLGGLPEDYIKARKQKNGYVRISTDYPDSGPIFAYADSNAIRHQLYLKSRSRGYPENVEPLESLLAKRYELATTLGYKNWATYATEDKMVKNPDRASAFLKDTARLSKKRAQEDYQILLAEKRRYQKDAKTLNEWERSYYTNKYKKRVLSLDTQEVRQYFAYNKVQDGIFKISEQLFGISIKEAKDAVTWHPDVGFYEVFDGKNKIGEFYLDMFPRENKFKHAAQFTLRSGYKGIQLPVAVLMCNFPRPSDKDPGLMEHGQVETYLHEFGHLLHSMFSGNHEWPSSLEWDFVEAPAQLLEEYVWDKDALHLFAKHHKTGELIPESLIKKMKDAAKVNLGINTLTQLHYATLSLELYNNNPKNIDILKLNEKIKERITPFAFVKNTYFPFSFGHLTGYSSNYYTYMWSQVIAKDMFSEFKKKASFPVKLLRGTERRC